MEQKKNPNEEVEIKPEETNLQEHLNREMFDQNLLSRLWEEKTRSGPDAMRGGELIRRRRRTFVVDGSVCAPDYFVDSEGTYFDFKVTMQALSSAEEIEAIENARTDQEIPLLLAKRCFHAINGVPVTSDQRDHLWEALGMGGRQLCLSIYLQHLGSAGAAALGKCLQSCTID